MFEEKRTRIGPNFWINKVWRGGSDDRSYIITIPKALGDKYKLDEYVRIEEHPTEEALIIRKL